MIIKNALAVNHFSEDMNMARRDNGTGTVYQRPNGSWVGRIYMGRGADGKPKYKCFSGKNQAEVKRKIKEFNQGGCKTDSTKVSVEEYILNWLKLYKKGSMPCTSLLHRPQGRLFHIRSKILFLSGSDWFFR